MSLVMINSAYLTLLLNKVPDFNQQMQYLRFLENCFCSVSIAKTFTQEEKQKVASYVQTHKFCLPRNFAKKKTLFLNLNRTLIISSFDKNPLLPQTFNFKDFTLYFSVRPYAIPFLQSLSQTYQLVIYSATLPNYTIEFFQYFNERTGNSLKKCLSREHCVEIRPGYFVPDIRLVKNRELSQMLFLSNQIMMFKDSPRNGVPIVDYTGDLFDRELVYMLGYLMELGKWEDVREGNRGFMTEELFGEVKIQAEKAKMTEVKVEMEGEGESTLGQ